MRQSVEPGGMAEAVTALLDALSDVGTVRIGPLGRADAFGERGPRSLTVWPLAILPQRGQDTSSKTTSGGDSSFRLRIRCVVVADGPAGPALDLLGRAFIAVTARPDLLLIQEPIPADVWLALGTVPRPALLVEMPVRIAARPMAASPPIRETPQIRDTPPTRQTPPTRHTPTVLHGHVFGPARVPLAGVRVTSDGSDRSAYTDTQGAFSLADLPTATTQLLLSVRGRQLTVEVDTSSTEPVVIHCLSEEA